MRDAPDAVGILRDIFANNCSGCTGTRFLGVNRDAFLFGELDGRCVEDFCARSCHFLHLFIADVRNLPGIADDSGVSGQDAVDIGVDFTGLGVKSGCESHCGGVRTATSQRSDFTLITHTLITSDNNDSLVFEFILNPKGPHLHESRIGMARSGNDSRLATGERDSFRSALANSHSQKRH